MIHPPDQTVRSDEFGTVDHESNRPYMGTEHGSRGGDGHVSRAACTEDPTTLETYDDCFVKERIQPNGFDFRSESVPGVTWLFGL